MSSKISIDGWRAFAATAEQGSTIRAADVLHKSQSALSHAIKKIELELGNALFEPAGRNLRLTALGHLILPKAKRLIADAEYVESLGKQYREGIQDEIGLAINNALPQAILVDAIERFELIYPKISLRLFDTTLSGTQQIMEEGRAVIGVSTILPTDIVIEPLLTVMKCCVCSTNHPLADMESLSLNELKPYQQVVIQDSGAANIDMGWLGASKRLSVSHFDHGLPFVMQGLGYSWMPEHRILPFIHSGQLKQLSLKSGQKRDMCLQIGARQESLVLNYVRDLFDLIKVAASTYEQNR